MSIQGTITIMIGIAQYVYECLISVGLPPSHVACLLDCVFVRLKSSGGKRGFVGRQAKKKRTESVNSQAIGQKQEKSR